LIHEKKITILADFSGTSLFLLAQTSADGPKPNLTITADLNSIQQPLSKLYLSYYNTSTKFRFNDSADLHNSKAAVFQLHLSEPILAQLKVVPDRTGDTSKRARQASAKDFLSVYLEAGKISIVAKDSLSNSYVTGSNAHQVYTALKAKTSAYDPAFTALYANYSEARKNKTSTELIENPIDSLDNLVKEKVYLSFLKAPATKNSPVAIYALIQYAGYAINPVTAEPVFKQLGAVPKSLPSGKIFEERIALAKKLEVGQYAIPFSQTDTAGKIFSLASLKGKVVLVDFWASWCGPCRKENPNVVKAYSQFHSKGFEVLGVSLDEEKKDWINAIAKDKLIWKQVSDLKGWASPTARLYNVEAIPTNFLIDGTGKIVATNLRGDDLEKKLTELLK